MRIEIIDKDGNSIQFLTMESNPFLVGQIIHLSVNNKDKEVWEIDEIQSSFIINNIEHYVRIDYNRNGKVYESISVSIEVSLADNG